jgi:hypothetical protein
MVDDGDTILSFDYPWHTHADLLACWYDQPRESATETFVTDLLNDRIVIVVARRGVRIRVRCLAGGRRLGS